MSTLGKKRIGAKEAAEFLGVPQATVSRIDQRGEIIKRYKLGHKTYVYDLESLELFLESKLVRPIRSPTVSPLGAAKPRQPVKLSFEKPKFSLLEFLPEKAQGRFKARNGGEK